MQLLKMARNVMQFSTQLLRTQVFSPMTNKQLATPELVRKVLNARLPFHSKVSLVSLYHKKRVRHATFSCFSQKKTKKFKKVNKIKKYIYSEILQRKLYIRMSNKAYRCIKKIGSFDRYILLTKPKDLDSKIGEYYRELMLRKINDPEYRIPYVLGSGRKELIRRHHKYYWTQQARKLVVPKEYKKKLITNQRKFGTVVQEFNEEDYQKFLEVQKLKKLWGKDVDTRHPLLLQIEAKMNVSLTEEQIAAMEEKAEQFKQEYLNHRKNKQLRQQTYEYNEREAEKQNAKVKQAWFKHEMFGGQETDQPAP